jgi:hypothetical protein
VLAAACCDGTNQRRAQLHPHPLLLLLLFTR